MLAYDLLDILRTHPRIPDRLGIDNHQRPIPALVQATGVVDAHSVPQPRQRHLPLERRMHSQPVTIHLSTVFATGADEDMLLPDIIGDIRCLFSLFSLFSLVSLFGLGLLAFYLAFCLVSCRFCHSAYAISSDIVVGQGLCPRVDDIVTYR